MRFYLNQPGPSFVQRLKLTRERVWRGPYSRSRGKRSCQQERGLRITKCGKVLPRTAKIRSSRSHAHLLLIYVFSTTRDSGVYTQKAKEGEDCSGASPEEKNWEQGTTTTEQLKQWWSCSPLVELFMRTGAVRLVPSCKAEHAAPALFVEGPGSKQGWRRKFWTNLV